MSGVVLSVRLDGGPSSFPAARAMAAAAVYRARCGMHEAELGSAIAISLDGGHEHAAHAPLVSANGSLLLVADARIDNRDQLAALLECDDTPDDRALILLAYRRWGEACVDRLAGEFALVIWDAAHRRLIAARDFSAVRPLVYRVEPTRILVASDVHQILAVADVPRRICDRQVVAWLADLDGLPASTFYEGIARVPPGATVVIENHQVRVRNHGTVVDRGVSSGTYEDHVEALRSLMLEAVRVRLNTVPAPGLLLSGGLDSTAIAACAGTLRRQAAVPTDLTTYSFAFDDLPDCDERHVSSLTAGYFGMRNVHVPAADAWPLAEYPNHGPDPDGPGRSRGYVVFDRVIERARADGVTTLMTGQRGDGVFGGDVVDYLGRLRAEGVGAAWREFDEHRRRSGGAGWPIARQFVVHRLLSSAWPRRYAPYARSLVTRAAPGVDGLPAWLRLDAVRRFDVRGIARDTLPRSPLSGEARRRRHQLILDPHLGRSAEFLERRCARAGIRYVDPWSDRRLAEGILHIPQYHLTPAGEPKRLVRDALGGLLPDVARLAARKRTPESLYHARGLADRARPVVWSLLEGSRAAARGYIDEQAARRAYADLLEHPGRESRPDWRRFWRLLDVEDWLRRIE